ncbi:MAG: DUF1593 domain-containing protein, partial [Halioglobus sp.]|nr:DUF1593 domain-containing protein [Halioglobus sp.]
MPRTPGLAGTGHRECLLVYANDIEIEGLIAATSRHLPHRVHPEFIERRVSAYQEVLPRLRVHDPAYPDGEQ